MENEQEVTRQIYQIMSSLTSKPYVDEANNGYAFEYEDAARYFVKEQKDIYPKLTIYRNIHS